MAEQMPEYLTKIKSIIYLELTANATWTNANVDIHSPLRNTHDQRRTTLDTTSDTIFNTHSTRIQKPYALILIVQKYTNRYIVIIYFTNWTRKE